MFHALANLSELYDGYIRPFRVQGYSLLLIENEGQRYVIEDRCPHMDAKLSTGKVVGEDIICRAHGIAFCMRTGKAQGPLADTLDCLRRFPVSYDGNKIGVEI